MLLGTSRRVKNCRVFCLRVEVRKETEFGRDVPVQPFEVHACRLRAPIAGNGCVDEHSDDFKCSKFCAWKFLVLFIGALIDLE
jgi:hypothetical protein